MKFKLREITNIEKKYYSGIVHDLEVKDNHSYNINNIIVHNSVCSTRIQTGHGIPTFQSLLDIKQRKFIRKSENLHCPLIISDGGIKNSGDIVKALAAGADLVMIGSLLAGVNESESPKNFNPLSVERGYKVYRGMASADAQIDWRGHSTAVEGVTSKVRLSGPLKNTIDDLMSGVRSGLSYSGARNIEELHEKAEFIVQTLAGYNESRPHILERN